KPDERDQKRREPYGQLKDHIDQHGRLSQMLAHLDIPIELPQFLRAKVAKLLRVERREHLLHAELLDFREHDGSSATAEHGEQREPDSTRPAHVLRTSAPRYEPHLRKRFHDANPTLPQFLTFRLDGTKRAD